MKPTSEILERIEKCSSEHKDGVFTRLYRYLLREDIYYAAYQKLYANKGATTQGIDNDTADGFSDFYVKELIQSLKDGTYKANPVRREYIPKKNGKLRPLGIPSFRDKLLQEVVRMILEAIYEPVFDSHSHGFRPGKSCHTALRQISSDFTGVVWFIEGDIQGCFDNINHERLIEILSRKIKDSRFLNIIRQFLKAGYTSTEAVTETILEITITHKTPEEMAQQYSFNDRQNEYLALMTEPENENLWAELLGGYVSGGGQIIEPNTNWEGTGIFQWPLPQSYTITSWFGYRADPFTGEIDYHSGTDIGAPGGTPILAAADGTVTIANGIDSWGGGYGYYIKVRHNDTYETLYAHCSSICVVAGQEVKQGEVIGYVGTTGNSTGNHLHFEVWQNGQRTDALSFFRAKG